MKTWIKFLLAIGAVAVLSAVSIFGINAYRAAQEQAEAERVALEQAQQQEAVVEALGIKFASPSQVEATKAPPPAAVVEEAPVEEEPVYESGPILCPPGTVAGAVDADGNESACQATNDQGQECVAYDDANNCTQWYQP